MFLETFGRPNENHALFANGFLDVGINRFAIELRLHPGEKFSFLLRNAETLERSLHVLRNFVPRALGTLTLGEVVSNLAKIDRFKVLARPMGWQWFALKNLQRFEPKFSNPVRILFHVRDVIHDALVQADTRVEAVIDLVMKVADIAINIDG